MDEIVKYMVEGKWKDDEKSERKRYLFKLAQESKSQTELSHKIGGMLIYNQVIEEFLKDIVEYSVNYIKAEIWPAQVHMKFDFSKATFGNLINYLPIKIRYDHPCCKDKPISACYRIYGSVYDKSEVKCVIETNQNPEYYAESGEEYVCSTLIKDKVMLTLGTRDTAYDEKIQYKVKHIDNGLIFTELTKKAKICIGVAWVNDTFEMDVRTWYAADPTLDKFKI